MKLLLLETVLYNTGFKPGLEFEDSMQLPELSKPNLWQYFMNCKSSSLVKKDLKLLTSSLSSWLRCLSPGTVEGRKDNKWFSRAVGME